ncbi:hypothetical protein F511_28942 [Dorcoceras hygrometricum]|uniref:Uncharacterized protein n=1 Tax=Dorcoceras hygrometricum TaxID=472368 RepID=A0A2Z7BX17_9LAMI|nr:hypothetical protein F511_28942 [Dorcoceras hygrometricum]
MKAKKQKARESHMVCHQKFHARIQEAEYSMQAQHLIIKALEAAAMQTWIPDVGVLARIQLLRVISCWYVSCDDHQIALRDFEATMFCVQEPAVGFVSVFHRG